MASVQVDEIFTKLSFKTDKTGLIEAESAIKTTKDKLDDLARKTAIVGAALSGIGLAVGGTALGFEEKMNSLSAVFLDATDEQITALRDLAKEMGSTTSKSASDAALAMAELARSGLSVDDTLAALPSVLNLAIAGELELADAAGLVTSAMAAFNLEADEAGRVTDVLAAAASASRTTVGEMGPALRQTGVQAASLGIPLERASALIGVLRNVGRIPGQAGTDVRNIIARLLDKPRERAKEGYEELGIDHSVIRGLMEEGRVTDALRVFSDAGMDARIAQLIFGAETAGGALALANNADEADALEGRLMGSGGTSDLMREAIESGAPGAVAELKSAFEGLQIAIGESGLLDGIKTIAEALTTMIDKFKNLPDPVLKFTSLMLTLGPGLIGVSTGLKLVSLGLSSTLIVKTVTGLMVAYNAALSICWVLLDKTYRRLFITAAAMKIKAAAAGLVRGATLLWAGAQWVLNASMYGFPLVWIIAAIAAVIAAIAGIVYLIIEYKDEIVNAFKAVIDWIKNNWETVLMGILLGPVWAVIWHFRDEIVGAFMAAWNFLKDTVWGWIKTVWNEIYNLLPAPIQNAIDYVADTLSGAFRAAFEFLKSVVWGWIKHRWNQVKELLTKPLSAAADFFKTNVVGAFQTAFGAIKDAAKSAFEFLVGIFNWVVDQFNATIGGIWDKITSVGGIVKDAAGGLWGGIKSVFGGGDDEDPPVAGVGGKTEVRQTNNANVETLNVNVNNGDPEAIASGVRGAIEEEFTNTSYTYDSGVRR